MVQLSAGCLFTWRRQQNKIDGGIVGNPKKKAGDSVDSEC